MTELTPEQVVEDLKTNTELFAQTEDLLLSAIKNFKRDIEHKHKGFQVIQLIDATDTMQDFIEDLLKISGRVPCTEPPFSDEDCQE